MSEFEGQRICIVGGTAGIGLAIAKCAALGDASVIVAGRDANRAERVAASIGLNVEGRAIDILDQTSISRFFADLGAVDHLIVTAAQVRPGAFRDGRISDARESMEGKFWAQYLCARHAQVRRSILLFSGTLGRRPVVGTAILAAINGAIDSLARALALELAPVRVNVISPGLIGGTQAYAGLSDAARMHMLAAAAARLPVRAVGNASSVSGLACAVLASPYVTGAIIDIDGGGLLV